MDPAVAYYTVDDEPISNVYETLISFNGTDTGPTPSNWVPEIATCVPGSAECSAQTGTSLVFNNGTTGLPQYYTFEISATAKFYDPATGTSWNVYPSDVLYSFIRTLMFANLPAFGYNNGWIQAQALLPSGNGSWDGGIHGLYNNTPAYVYSSILVNDSAYCPTSTLPTNGCVTFNVGGSGAAWPYYLELVSDPLGGSITPCGTFTYLGAPLPGFFGTNAPKGDGPCLLPGNATSSTSPAFKNYVSTVSPTLWDSLQELELTAPPSPQPGVQYNMVGSGPYYAITVSASGGPGGSGGYTLAADPTYVAPAGCAGQPNCLPAPGNYIPNVVVYWDNDDTLGLQEAIAGQADGFGYDESHTSTVLDLVHEGVYGLMQNIVTGDNWNMMFELTFNTTNEAAIDPNGAGATNVPGDFLSNNGLRQFLVHAYPYNTIENTIWTVDGVKYAENYGGAIPPAQSFYYPTNISWPAGDPITNPAIAGGAASWWQNITNSGSPWYDSELSACTPSTPCTFAIQGWVGAPSLDAAMSAWIASVKSLTDGAIVMYYFDITGSELYGQVGLGNGAGSLPVYNWGWVPDYADPTDYMVPFWLPNGTFSYAQGLYSTFAEPAYNNVAACGHASGSFADLAYWAGQTSILSECQGIAYSALVTWNALAAHESNITFRVLEYNMIEHVGNLLAFEVYAYTSTLVVDYGTWIAPTGINVNPSVGGGGVQTWYTWAYETNVFNVDLKQTTLPGTTVWSATLDGKTLSSTGVASTNDYVNFTGLANGSYTYTVGFVSGYGASPSNGTAVISGANDTIAITFAAFSGPTDTLTFTEAGLVSNTSWTMVVQNVGALTSQMPAIPFTLPANVSGWAYAPQVVIGYTDSGPGTTAAFTGLLAVNVNVTYTGVILTTYAVTFASTGLPPSDSWTVSLDGFTLTSTAANITFYEENNTYDFTLSVPAGLSAPANAGQVTVAGANVVVAIPMTTPLNGFALNFVQSGLPANTPWSVTVNGFGILSNGTTISFQLPNGTYSWAVATIGGWTTTWTGSEVLNGTAATVKVVFVPFTYAVTFFEGGLAAGVMWSVTVNGVATTPTSNYFTSVQLPNGTYAFTVPAIAGYTATPGSGNVIVAAGPATQVIIYGPVLPTYTVTFTTSTLPTGATWTVYFGSQTPITGTADSVSFTTTNGPWTYAITAPSGWVASPSGGTVTVNGANQTVSIGFTQVTGGGSTTTTTGFSTLAYALIGLFAVLAVIFLALALYWRGREPPSAAPPQSWESGDKPTTESNEGSSPPSS
ncbi:MAG: hypothetical protein L3J68_00690 [Thermoplasmata archaeon]|nr:hypothetical protein [Thermoplasmata archaeon]